MSKQVTERSRGSRGAKNVQKVRKVPKTGAERIRAYRARIKALEIENAAAAKSTTNTDGMARQTASQQDFEDNKVDMRGNERSILYEALNQGSQIDQQAGDKTQLNGHLKTAMTPAERARAYRARKKALKNATKTQVMTDTTHSDVDDKTERGEVSQVAINAGTSAQFGVGQRPYEHIVEAPSRPSPSGSSTSGVESSAAASIHYKPTLWYYKHLNFLSGNKDPVSDDSDSDHNDDTVYVQVRGKKRKISTTIAQEGEPETSIDASAAAFGRSVGAQLHHLSKMQRCIAEKLISDVIYHAKMEQLSLDTSIDVKEATDEQVNSLTAKAEPSWYDTDTTLEAAEQDSSSGHILETKEDLIKREIAETESAVSFIKMESDDTENYCFQDVEEQSHAIAAIIKEELL